MDSRELKRALEVACRKGSILLTQCLLSHGAPISARCILEVCERGHIEVLQRLLFFDADVNDSGDRGLTGLHKASEKGHPDIARTLVASGANVNVTDKDGVTPLMLGCAHGGACTVGLNRPLSDTPCQTSPLCGHAEVVLLLVENGALVNAKDSSGSTPLVRSVQYWDANIASFLIENGADVSVADADGVTVLHKACERGRTDVVRLILAASSGSDVHLADRYGESSLIKASIGGHVDTVSLLLLHEASVDQAENNGCTSLAWAAVHGHVDTVRCLLDAGADPNSLNRADVSVVAGAAEGGHVQVLDIMLALTANLNALDISGQTALMKASEKGHVDTCKLLVDSGAGVNIFDRRHETALMLAKRLGHTAIEQYLTLHGAEVSPLCKFLVACKDDDVEGAKQMLDTPRCFNIDAFLHDFKPPSTTDRASSIRNRTGLMLAAQAGHADLCRRLLSLGSDVNQFTNTTALHLASGQGHLEVVKLLVVHHADIDAMDADGASSLLVAVESDHVDVVVYLLEQVCRLQCIAAKAMHRLPALPHNVPKLLRGFIARHKI